MRLSPALTACCLLATSVAQADVWSWKDASGVAHYSDTPVEGAVLVKSTVPHTAAGGGPSSPSGGSAAAEPKSKLAAMNDAADASRAKQNAELAVQQDLARKQDEQCKQAKNTYNDSIAARRIYKSAADGSHEYMSDAEADEYRVKARAEMDAVCGKADPSAVR